MVSMYRWYVWYLRITTPSLAHDVWLFLPSSLDNRPRRIPSNVLHYCCTRGPYIHTSTSRFLYDDTRLSLELSNQATAAMTSYT